MTTKLSILIVFMALLSTSAEAGSEKLRPDNLDFSNLENEINSYLDSVDKEDRDIEERRIGIIKNFKKMAIKILDKNPYEGRISLKKTSFQGQILKAHISMIIVKANDKAKSFKWHEMSPRFFADVFTNAAVNKAAKLSSTNRTGSEKSFEKAANYYYALAVFYDWYENPEAAKIFRTKALTLNPGLKEEIDKMWPDKQLSKKEASEQ